MVEPQCSLCWGEVKCEFCLPPPTPTEGSRRDLYPPDDELREQVVSLLLGATTRTPSPLCPSRSGCDHDFVLPRILREPGVRIDPRRVSCNKVSRALFEVKERVVEWVQGPAAMSMGVKLILAINRVVWRRRSIINGNAYYRDSESALIVDYHNDNDLDDWSIMGDGLILSAFDGDANHHDNGGFDCIRRPSTCAGNECLTDEPSPLVKAAYSVADKIGGVWLRWREWELDYCETCYNTQVLPTLVSSIVDALTSCWLLENDPITPITPTAPIGPKPSVQGSVVSSSSSWSTSTVNKKKENDAWLGICRDMARIVASYIDTHGHCALKKADEDGSVRMVQTSVITEWLCCLYRRHKWYSRAWFVNCNPNSHLYGFVFSSGLDCPSLDSSDLYHCSARRIEDCVTPQG